METYKGHVRAPADAVILFEACRVGLLPRVQRRLSEKERQSIQSGSVFVWDEREAGMRRWTDGKSWSASRVSGSFLTYREMEGKRGGSGYERHANRDGVQGTDPDSDGGPNGYRYKTDGLMKQSFSITTTNGQHLHLISYFIRSTTSAQSLMQPTNDPALRHIRPEKGMYPESTVHEQSNQIPAVTCGPMGSPGFSASPHQPADTSPYARPPYGPPPPHMMVYPHPGWAQAPPSPMHTPPPHYSPYYHPGSYGPSPQGYPGQSPLQHVCYPPQAPSYLAPPPMTAFDRPPPPLSNSGLPPPPPPQHYAHHGHPASLPNYNNGYPSNGYPVYPPPQPQHYPHNLAQQQPPPRQAPYEYQQPQQQPSPLQALSEYPPPQQQPPPQYKESRQYSHQPTYGNSDQQHAQAGAQQAPPSTTTNSATTIPSISSLINGTSEALVKPRSNSTSPNIAARNAAQEIPSYKIGFEQNRDVQALRNLDKATFKGY